MDEHDLEKLMCRVAYHLCGHPCNVRLREPVADGAGGQVYRTKDGFKAMMHIHPALKFDKMLYTFCHEAAHLLLDWSKIPAGFDHVKAEGSVTRTPEQRAAWKADPMETRADALAKKWLDYANSRYYDFVQSGDPSPIVPKLRALMNWPK
jgi:hypothetical protein